MGGGSVECHVFIFAFNIIISRLIAGTQSKTSPENMKKNINKHVSITVLLLTITAIGTSLKHQRPHVHGYTNTAPKGTEIQKWKLDRAEKHPVGVETALTGVQLL